MQIAQMRCAALGLQHVVVTVVVNSCPPCSATKFFTERDIALRTRAEKFSHAAACCDFAAARNVKPPLIVTGGRRADAWHTDCLCFRHFHRRSKCKQSSQQY